MKHLRLLSLVNLSIFLCVLFPLLACVRSATGASPEGIPPDEVQQWRQAKKPFLLIDVRPHLAFKNKHIEGAVNIQSFIIHKKGLPQNEVLVLYDGGIGSLEAKEAAAKLTDAGYSLVYILQGGLAGWEKNGFPMVVPVGVVNTLLVESITVPELSRAIKEGMDMLLVDVRSAEAFQESTIPGAENIQPRNLLSLSSGWTKDTLIVLFDNGDGEAARQAEQLRRTGFKIMRFLFGGYPEWRKQNAL